MQCLAAADIAGDLRYRGAQTWILRLTLKHGKCSCKTEPSGDHGAEIARHQDLVVFLDRRQTSVPVGDAQLTSRLLVERDDLSSFATNDIVEFEAILCFGGTFVHFTVIFFCGVTKARHDSKYIAPR